MRRRNPLHGEWWIDGSGQAQYADGDVGDMNHEAYVIDSVTLDFLNHMNIQNDDERVGLLSDHEDDVEEWLNDEGVEFDPEEDDVLDVAEKILRDEMVPGTFKTPQQFSDAWAVANGRGRDPREYALEYDGWKRVKGNWVETWTLTKGDLSHIADGLSDAAGEDTDLDSETFNIEVRRARTEYRDVPWHVIESGDLSELRQYAQKY